MANSHEKLEDTLRYLGIKFVDAKPMTLGKYNEYRGWEIPVDEDPASEGFIVQYPDSYVSWCPKAQFDEANRCTTGMTFGHAIEALKKGLKVARAGWNGKGMWLMMINGSNPRFTPGSQYAEALGEFGDSAGNVEQIPINPHIDMFTADQCMQPGWLASQTDMLADDWCIV